MNTSTNSYIDCYDPYVLVAYRLICEIKTTTN